MDTDHLVLLQQQSEPEWSRIRERMLQFSEDAFLVSIVSMHEQIAGWQAFLNKRKSLDDIVSGYRRLHEVLIDFSGRQVIGYGPQHAVVFKDLRQQKVRVGTMDLRIAATALLEGWTVLTRNTVDFQRVPGLAYADWTEKLGTKPR